MQEIVLVKFINDAAHAIAKLSDEFNSLVADGRPHKAEGVANRLSILKQTRLDAITRYNVLLSPINCKFVE